MNIGMNIDDLIFTSVSAQHVRANFKAIEDKYIQLKIHEGDTHNYLGMVLNFAEAWNGHINQTGMVEKITRSQQLARWLQCRGSCLVFLFHHTCLVFCTYPASAKSSTIPK